MSLRVFGRQRLYRAFSLATCLLAVQSAFAQEPLTPLPAPSQTATAYQGGWVVDQVFTEPEEEEPLATDRPDFTEAASVVGLGRVQIEAGYTFAEDDEDGVRSREHSFPELLVRVGAIADWLEFRFGWNYAVNNLRGGGQNDDVDGGEDIYLGAKILLFEQEGCRPDLAVMPQMTVPTGADAFSADDTLPGLSFLYAWELNDWLSLAGSTQGNRAVDGLGEDYIEYAQSVSLAYGLTDNVGAYTEWFAFFPQNARENGVGAEHYFNGGFTYLVNPNLQFDVRAGVGLNERAQDFFTGSGVAIRF